jgi:prevent-host-death family protein
MSHVGVRDLKNQLSRYLKRVQNGEEIVVTEHDRPVAKIIPAKPLEVRRMLEPLLQEGIVTWAGGKPRGSRRRPVIKKGSVADLVIDDRR